MPQAAGFVFGALGGTAAATGSAFAVGAAAGAAFAATTAGGILTNLLASVALSALGTALTPKPKHPGLRSETVLAGDTTPQAWGVGLYATRGSRSYPALTLPNGNKPNVFEVHRIDLSDVPGVALRKLYIREVEVPIDWEATPHPDFGAPLGGRFVDDGKVHGWVKFYDGHQTTADPMMVAKFGVHPDFPYDASFVGYGIAYAILTLKWNPNILRGDEGDTAVWELDGIPEYDRRLDATAGGIPLGTHRLDDPATWQTTQNPMVIAAGILRGTELAPDLVWGGDVANDDVVPDALFSASNVADADALIGTGTGPRYRCGMEIRATDEPAEILGEIFKAASAKVVDIGGRWHLRAGPPPPPTLGIAADDILVSRRLDQVFASGEDEGPNAVVPAIPDPASGWQPRELPIVRNADLIAVQGGEVAVTVSYPAVPFRGRAVLLAREQVADEARQMRLALATVPEAAQAIPLDTVDVTDPEQGHDGDTFEVAAVELSLDSLIPAFGLRIVDPADFDPAASADLPDVPVAQIVLPAQTVPGFDLRAATVTSGGQSRPGLEIVWTTSDDLRDWRGIVFEVRLAATGVVVARGTITDLTTGVHPVDHPATQFAATTYEARVMPYAPGVPVAWTAWSPATTPDVRLAAADLSDAVQGDIADGVEGRDLAVRAAVAGWVRDPIGARWSAPGTLDPAYWATEDAAGVLTQATGPTGAGIAIAVPAGGGRSTALIPVLAGADPKATLVTVNLDVTFDAGDPFVPAAAVEWWTGAQWLPGELVTDGWGPQLLPGAVGVYDFANMASMWQDDAGTVPAVVGQPVARVTDLAGLRALKQTSAAQRPTLRLTAGRLALQWDGGDLLFADNSAWGTDAVTVAAAYLKETTQLGSLVNWGSDPVSGNGTWEIQSSGSGTLGDVFSTRGTVRVPLISNSPSPPVAQILTMTADISTPVVTARRNGVQVATSSASQGAGNYGTTLLRVGSRANGSQRLDAHVYALALFNRVLDADELVQVEAWLSRRASPAGTFAALGITVAAGVRQGHAWTVRRPATADNVTPPRLRLTAANPLITTAQTLTLHRLDVRGTTQAEVDARQALLDAAAASTAAAGALAQAPIVVASLPATGDFLGQFAYLIPDTKIYRWTGAAWSRAVDGNDLVADSVIAGKVAAAVIGARELAADAVTASKVLITDQTNLVRDNQLQDADAWSNGANFLVIPSSSAGALVNSAGEIRYVGALPVVSAVVVDSLPFSVVPGEEFRCSGQIGRINGTSYTARATIRFETLDGSSGVTKNIGSAVTTTSSAIQTVSGVVVAPTSPAGLLRARFRWVIDSTDGNVRFFAPVVRRRFGGELIVDGGIITDNLEDRSVTDPGSVTNTTTQFSTDPATWQTWQSVNVSVPVDNTDLRVDVNARYFKASDPGAVGVPWGLRLTIDGTVHTVEEGTFQSHVTVTRNKIVAAGTRTILVEHKLDPLMRGRELQINWSGVKK